MEERITMKRVGDIYDKDGVYFIIIGITKTIDGITSEAIPLSRYILSNYTGTTKDALNAYADLILEYEEQKSLVK
jgi:hypothetical protein